VVQQTWIATGTITVLDWATFAPAACATARTATLAAPPP